MQLLWRGWLDLTLCPVSPKSNCAQIGCLLLAGPADRPSTHSLVLALHFVAATAWAIPSKLQLLIAIIHSAAGGCVRGLRIRIKRSFSIPSSSSWFVYFLSMASALLMPLFRSAALLLCAWSALASACASNGICGGACCGPVCTPPPVPCNPSSCQPGYSCGHYGCARNRARSALTRTDGLVVPVEEFLNRSVVAPSRNIFGVERQSPSSFGDHQQRGIDQKTFLKLTNPNFLFRQCCEDRRLPDACLWKCHFNTYTKDALQQMFFKQDPCPIEAAADLQYCAAQGRDHSGCCKAVGIGSTLAGSKCLTFCDQRAGKLTKLDYSYLPCYDRFESMKRCFYDEIRVHMETQLRPKLNADFKK